ncbi:predicted protein [Sclerotinia sclerotiorum 1980 UF-70]|uniref:Uncharacterized protein n=1 Tax=Sclerotinia sclerotiorum (strain ATCC 18683 / 1980 / Ss-1) TaxID=665079 RepID=A7EWU1_SCLS1|nr:predicted protein [Sclerotinia sclerotiorum 1980 UF-70]EDN93933.1 predicted protein [Sclerotinia sclerotiorum 1980 UF-70]
MSNELHEPVLDLLSSKNLLNPDRQCWNGIGDTKLPTKRHPHRNPTTTTIPTPQS